MADTSRRRAVLSHDLLATCTPFGILPINRRTVLGESLLGRLNHDRAACLNSERIEPSEATS